MKTTASKKQKIQIKEGAKEAPLFFTLRLEKKVSYDYFSKGLITRSNTPIILEIKMP